MKTRTIIPAALALAMLGTPALAGPGPALPAAAAADHERFTAAMECTAYEHQFDKEIKSRAFVPLVDEARALRADGGKLCATGKRTEGIIKLEHALRDLGVTPSRG